MVVWIKSGWVGALALALSGCPSDPPSMETEGGSSGIPMTTSPSSSSGPDTSGGMDTEVATGTGTGVTTTGVDGSSTSSGSSSGDTTEGTETTGGATVDCPSENNVLQCGDGIDNDGDGHVDLFDPECIGPCDDDEGSFQTGLPGDNMDCLQDCFFDGDSGSGNDGCEWSLTCDPANPGAGLEPVECLYNPGPQCDNMEAAPTPECIEACTPYVPPGCDCFGCCIIDTPEGPVNVFLNSEPPCSLENLEACNDCTPQIDLCGTPCIPEDCALCFGQTELPEGCEDTECLNDQPCDDVSDCPTEYFCYLGCCYPPPVG
jgi:hypothetical protein